MAERNIIKKSIDYEHGYRDGFIEGRQQMTQILSNFFQLLPPADIKINQGDFNRYLKKAIEENNDKKM